MTDDTRPDSYRSADEQDIQVRIDGEEYGLDELVSAFGSLPGFARDLLSGETDYDVRIDDVEVEVDGEGVMLDSLNDAVPQRIYDEVESRLEEYEQQIEGYLEELEERKEEFAELEEAYRELEEDREERLQEVYELIDQKDLEIRALQRKVSEKQDEIQEVKEEYMNERDRFLRQRNEAQQMAGRIRRLEAENEELEEALDILEEQRDEAWEELEQLRGEQYGDSSTGHQQGSGEGETSEYLLPESEIENASYDNLGGIDEQIERLRRPVLLNDIYPGAMQNIEDSSSGDKKYARLLVGPPGTGKTESAKAVANEVDMPVYLVNGPEIIDGIVGQAESNVEGLFDEAREAASENGAAMLIFDEIDSISRERGDINTTGVNDRVVNQLLSEMDGVLDNENLYVLATTNRPDVMDPALKRPGRFDDIIIYPRPEREATEEIAEIYFPEEIVDDVVDIIDEYDDLDDPKINSGDSIRAVADTAKKEFLMEDYNRGGDLIREIAEQEVEQVRQGEQPEVMAQLGGEDIKQLEGNKWSLDELSDEQIRRQVDKHLFGTKDHLRYIPRDILEDAVEEVYSQADEGQQGGNVDEGAIRGIFSPEGEETAEEVEVAGA